MCVCLKQFYEHLIMTFYVNQLPWDMGVYVCMRVCNNRWKQYAVQEVFEEFERETRQVGLVLNQDKTRYTKFQGLET